MSTPVCCTAVLLVLANLAAAESVQGETPAPTTDGATTTVTLPDGTVRTTTVKTYADGSREERVVTRSPAGTTSSTVSVSGKPATTSTSIPRSPLLLHDASSSNVDTRGFGLALWRRIDDRRDGPPGSYATGVGVGLAAWQEFRIGANYFWGRDWGAAQRGGTVYTRLTPDESIRVDTIVTGFFEHAAGLPDWSIRAQAGFKMGIVEPTWTYDHQGIGDGDIDAFGPGLRLHLGEHSRLDVAWISQVHRGGTEDSIDVAARITIDAVQIRAGLASGTTVAPREASARTSSLSGGLQFWDIVSIDIAANRRSDRYAGYTLSFGLYSPL